MNIRGGLEEEILIHGPSFLTYDHKHEVEHPFDQSDIWKI